MADGFNNVVSREAAWFTTDPATGYTTAPAQLLHRTRTVTDGLLYTNSLVASSNTAAFTSADVGSTLTGGAIPASSTIVTVTNASSVILSASSTASSTGTTLTLDNGAPFDIVQGYFRKVPPRSRNLFITCEGIARNELVEWQAHRESIYLMVATIHWSFEAGTGKLEDEQQNLDTAIEKVLQRIYGRMTDKTHNNAFTAVAAGGPEGDGRITMRLGNPYQAVTAREPLTAEIHYTATDWLVGGAT